MPYTVELNNHTDTLSGSFMQAHILRRGAEPFSLRLNHPQEGTIGLLLNDGIEHPQHDYWECHAPLLFPIVGGLVNGRSQTRDGREITMGLHGFARDIVFTVRDSGTDSQCAWIEYAIDHTQLPDGVAYPWRFEFTVRYILAANRLKVVMGVTNFDRTPMWYQMGWHPGFKTPVLGARGDKSDVQLLLPEGEYALYEVDQRSLLTGESETRRLGGRFPFTEEGLARTYIFDMSKIVTRQVALYDPGSHIRISLAFDDLPHLGVWSDANAPFICLEPWQGCDDYVQQTCFEEKFGIFALEPDHADRREILLTIDY